MPEPYCAIRRTSNELGQEVFILTLFHRLYTLISNLQIVLNLLDVMNWATMRHESAVDCNLIELLDIPHKHHPV